MVPSCQECWLDGVFGFRLVGVHMFSPWQAVRVLLAVMTALPVAGGAVLLAHASGTHPRLAPQVHPVGEGGSVTQAASARQAAPAVVGGPAGVPVEGGAVAT